METVMERVIQQFSLEKGRPEEFIRSEWINLVGERNATYAQPLSLHKNSRLYVAVSNPVVKQEMHFHKKIILRRLKKLPGCSEIRDIVFRAG